MNRQLFYNHKKHLNWLKNIYRNQFYKWVIKRFLKDCKTVMDVGTGRGLFYNTACELNKDTHGVDLVEENTGGNIKLMSFKDIKTHYDCFWNSQLIEHVNQYELMEVMSKHCDKILITMTTKPYKRFWDTPDHIRPYTIEAVRRLYRSYGFKVIYARNLYPTKSFIVVGKKQTDNK